jgi:hypothetical protein
MEQRADDKAKGKKFASMSFLEKCTFVGKAFVFIASMGFLYPNIFSD